MGTVSGMLGSIWRSNDTNKSYWVRNTPTVEKAPPGSPTVRRPVHAAALPGLRPAERRPGRGNNFFLEPLDQGGYLVRRLALSAKGGTLGWTANEAWGHIFQDLTAVTYHPYGYLVGVNATTGKPRWPCRGPGGRQRRSPAVEPYAGNGERPGLSMTPTALCCTLDGVVIVLEPGANRMQAFNVNGNPVQYFGSDDGRTSLRSEHGSRATPGSASRSTARTTCTC